MRGLVTFQLLGRGVCKKFCQKGGVSNSSFLSCTVEAYRRGLGNCCQSKRGGGKLLSADEGGCNFPRASSSFPTPYRK